MPHIVLAPGMMALMQDRLVLSLMKLPASYTQSFVKGFLDIKRRHTSAQNKESILITIVVEWWESECFISRHTHAV